MAWLALGAVLFAVWAVAALGALRRTPGPRVLWRPEGPPQSAADLEYAGRGLVRLIGRRPAAVLAVEPPRRLAGEGRRVLRALAREFPAVLLLEEPEASGPGDGDGAPPRSGRPGWDVVLRGVPGPANRLWWVEARRTIEEAERVGRRRKELPTKPRNERG